MRTDWIGLCLYPEIKFRITQHFILNPELAQNQTQIARSLSTGQVSVSRHISDLVSLRVLNEERFGRSAVYRLNTASALVNDFLSKIVIMNKNFLLDWVQNHMRRLPTKYRGQVQRIILFGSAARFKMDLFSDVDLLAVVERSSPELIFELQSLLVAGGSQEGLKISLRVEKSAAIYADGQGKAYLGEAKREGVVLWPK